MSYIGGFIMLPMGITGERLHKHSEARGQWVSEETLVAMNTVQRVPLRISRQQYDTMEAAFEAGLDISDVVSSAEEALPSNFNDAEWEALSDDEKQSIKGERAEIHGRNARKAARREAFLRQLTMFEEHKTLERFWIPVRLDFRGRVYYMVPDFNPQSNDIVRGLLRFANKRPLTEAGAYWLAVYLANSYGEDKLTLDKRVKWVFDHEEFIRETVDEPIDGSQRWIGADEPWQFLDACREWVRYLDQGPEVETDIPVFVDGTCNGLQHLSAMGLDPEGARATNLLPLNKRHDIYSEVAEVVNDIVNRDSFTWETARNWQGHVDRKTVKRGVMTVPYGVTDIGMKEQLISDRMVEGVPGDPHENAVYLAEVMKEAIGRVVIKAREIMDWFQTCAEMRAAENKPLDWTTPVGNTVRQAYYNTSCQRVRTLFGGASYRLAVHEEDADLGLNTRKQILGAAPNIIHSFDGAHLVKAVNVAHRKHEINDFMVVHDSFGTHPSDMPGMQTALRSTFIDIYDTNWLEDLYKEFQQDVRQSLPTPPEPGELKIKEVANAPYFFS